MRLNRITISILVVLLSLVIIAYSPLPSLLISSYSYDPIKAEKTYHAIVFSESLPDYFTEKENSHLEDVKVLWKIGIIVTILLLLFLKVTTLLKTS